MLNLSKLD